jgi:hypothetical protein
LLLGHFQALETAAGTVPLAPQNLLEVIPKRRLTTGEALVLSTHAGEINGDSAWSRPCHGEALAKMNGMTPRLSQMRTTMNRPFRVRTAGGRSTKTQSAVLTVSNISPRRTLRLAGSPGG